jgi:hypothetical protein
VGAFAKGFAVTAEMSGLEAAYKNPAGINGIASATFSSVYTSQMDSFAQLANVGFGLPLGPIKMAINVPMMAISDIPLTVDSAGRGSQIGSFSDTKINGILSLGMDVMENLHLGVNADYAYEKLAEQSGNGLGFDAGLIVDLPLFSLGASWQNLGGMAINWTTGYSDMIPQRFNFGVSTIETGFGRILADASSMSGRSAEMNVGYDAHLSPFFELQLGEHDLRVAKEFHIGFSLRLDGAQITYAFAQNQDLGSIHKIGIQYEVH